MSPKSPSFLVNYGIDGQTLLPLLSCKGSFVLTQKASSSGSSATGVPFGAAPTEAPCLIGLNLASTLMGRVVIGPSCRYTVLCLVIGGVDGHLVRLRNGGGGERGASALGRQQQRRALG